MVKIAVPTRIRLTTPCILLICVLTATALAEGSTSQTPNNPQEVNDAAAYNARGLKSYESGDYQAAVKYYKQAIKLKKDYADARFNLGDAYFRLSKLKQAIEEYKQALKYQPDLVLAYNNMGTAYYKLGQDKKAIEAYKQAIRLDPKSGSIYFNLAATYLQRGNEKAALDQYRILKTLDSELAHKLYLLITKPMAGVFDATTGVRLNVIATDSQGNPAGDLNQDDFQVFEDSAPQSITSFSREQFPLAYGLVIDNSGSIRPTLPQVVEVAKALIQSNRSIDETLLIRFVDSDEIATVQEFTSDKSLLNDGIDSLFVTAGQSAILDAVYLSAQRVAQYKSEESRYLRRAVVLISDGEERLSYYGINDLLGLLRRIDVQVFTICIYRDAEKGLQLNQNLPKGAVELLTTLADETGGRAFFPASESEFSAVVEQLTAIMHNQYLIGYKPPKVETEVMRRVIVKTVDKDGRNKTRVTVRAGYVVPEAKPLP